ncbi:unnamed protein product [Colias eurytheme]|nr:unnamed protein product [Colias eurytheme]
MSSSKTRKRKAFVKGPVIESDNETTEVLVLPPKLLEKLGISIGNIDAGLNEQKDQLNNSGSDLILHNEVYNSALFQMSSPKTNNVNPDTSIMETANLMKESVFLSPTFSSSSVSVPSYIGDDIVSSTSSLDENGKDKKIDVEFEKIESNFINHEIVSSTKENANDLINENNEKQIAKSPDFAFKDKNKDTQILNQNIVTNGIKPKIKTNNKICVISEEVITPCNIKELKTFDKPSNSTLIPIPINSIITTEKLKEKSKNTKNKNIIDCNSKQLNPKSIQNNDNVENINNISKENSTNTVSISLSDSLNNTAIKDNYESSNTKMLNGEVVDKNTPGGDIIKTQNHGHSEEVDFNLKSDLISDKFISCAKDDLKIEQMAGENGTTAEKANCTEINGNEIMLPPENKKSNQEEYVQSSDMIILNPKEILDQTHHKANNDKDDSFLNNFNNSLISKDCPLNKNRCGIQSKLHIQGVEKPGGHDLVNRNTLAIRNNKDSLRTYTRKPLKIHVPLKETYNKPLIQDLNSDTIEISEMLNEQAFCVCHDFGHYSYYDEKETYEHLHFLTRKNVQCSSDIIFSIYSDDPKLVHVHDQKFEENLERFGEEIIADVADEDSKICYNYISHDFDMNTEIQSNIDNKSNKMNQTILGDNMNDDITTDDNHTNISTLVNGPQPSTITTEAKLQPVSDTIILSDVCTPESMDSGEKRIFEIEIEIAPNPCNIEDDHLQKPIMTRGKRKRLESDHTPLIHLKKKPKVVNSKNNPNYDDKISQECPETRQSDVNQSFLSETTDVNLKIEKEEQNDTIICGVCQFKLRNDMWIAHISREHSYLAWRESDTPLDFSNEDVVYDHLNKILNQLGHLICGRCGIERESTKKYLRHVNKCSVVPGVCFIDVPSGVHIVKCGVCHKEVADWIGHIAKEHNYLAWREGELPINFENETIVRQYLHSIAKQIGGLTCAKCGCCRKYVKAYLDHINTCGAEKSNYEPGEVVKCGVCQEEVRDWYTHIGEKHNYIAWADGEPALKVDDEESVQKHLNSIVKQIGELVCSKCGYHRKHVNSYLNHIKLCEGLMNTTLNSTLDSTLDSTRNTVKCGVCDKEVREKNWIKHIQQEHNYIAWTQDGTPLDTNDKEAVYDYLYTISKEYNGLICSKCGIRRKYVKLYLSHIKTCTGSSDNSNNSEADVSNLDSSVAEDTALESGPLVKCGVCQKEITNGSWLRHIEKEHDYIAWKENETPLKVDDEESVQKHLNSIVKQIGELVCSKCGYHRKHVNSYLNHIKVCEGLMNTTLNSTLDSTLDSTRNTVKCGVCDKEVREKNWIKHIQQEHNYIAWTQDATPLDTNDKEAVYDYLYTISKEYNGLICSKCGIRRKYVKLYLSHIKTCTGSSDNFNNPEADISNLDSSVAEDTSLDSEPLVKCGVCQKEVTNGSWLRHIEKEHDYIAWKENETPLNTNNKNEVHDYLYNITKQNNGLVCSQCGCRRKYVKAYLDHIQACKNENNDSPNDSLLNSSTVDENASNILIKNESKKCGVCQEEVEDDLWLNHIEEKHNYMAWRENEQPLNSSDKDEIYEHLYNISKQNNGLLCLKCGCRRKYVKSYLSHIKGCTGNPDYTNDSIADTSNLDQSIVETNDKAPVKCGVCHKEIESGNWVTHIKEEHDYIAWKENEAPLDVNDNDALYKHYYNIVQTYGQLTCKKCGCQRKYAKSYMSHVQSCTGDYMDPTFVQIQKETQDNKIVKCGVCQLEMENKRWTTHIQRFHKYVAWQEGETPLDTEDENQVNEHLYNMSKKYGGLTCAKCNVTKKYVKVFLAHIESCDVDVDVKALPDYEMNSDTYECALCHETGPISEWKKHAMKKHYNVAWMVGDVPIDLKNLPCVEKYLKEYQKYHKTLRCLECGMVRISITGFYAHVMFCGKTEEEKDMYKSYCEICNNKYIGVYKAQHMKAHREQEYAQMNKQMIEARQEAILNQKPEDEETPGKRRAAEKAKNVIKNITTKTEDKENTDDDISDDNYDETRDDSSSESDDSVTIEPTSDEESIDTEIDSDVSNDDKIEVKRKKKYGESSFATINNKRIPFTVSQPAAYIADSAKEFFKTHYTSSTLFPQWLSCEYEAVPEDQLAKYMPPLAKSCNVMYSTDGWTTYDRFEARKGKGLSLFVGASINNIRWVPPRKNCENTPYLSVNCYNGPDAPRLDVTQTVEHPAMIQIWDFQDMSDLPSFVFGIAHDLGTVWSMDWCPSGACELLKDEETKGFTRLGLLAVACSSGSAYIFSVPHPSSIIEGDKLVYKLKPVVELRMCRSKNQKFQSTAISWSNNKGHACIIVGYSNGATANFDLNTDSPLLTCVEDGVTVFYPFHDEKSHSACVNDVVSLCGGAGGAEWRWSGSCSTSATGTTAVLGAPAATAGTAHVQLTATHIAREPLWPAALLTGNSDIVSQAINEVDWWGSGRRLGPVSAACGCAHCARLAAFIPPLLKTMFLHPVFQDKRELQVRIKIDMVPLKENKDSKKKSEQPLKLESYVYEEVTKYYGIEYKYASDLDKSDIQHHLNKPRKKSPDQFPLAEVTSMEFCPVPIYHKKLAIATHSGMLFVINT